MSNRLLSLSLGAAALLAPAAARADDLADARLELVRYDLAIDAAKAGDRAESQVQMDPDGCTAAIAKMKQLGAKPTDTIDGRAAFTLQQAPAHCDEYRQARALVQGAVVLAAGAHEWMIVSGFSPGDVGQGWIDRAKASGDACVAGVDAAVKAGAPSDVKVKFDGSGPQELTLADGKQQICGALLGWGKGYAAASAKAKAEGDAAMRQKYAGVGGDRLKLLIEYDDVYWRGKGCEIVDDVAKLKKAPLLFQWLENDDGTHTIRRYQFKGDKLVKTTNKTFRTEAQAYKGCK